MTTVLLRSMRYAADSRWLPLSCRIAVIEPGLWALSRRKISNTVVPLETPYGTRLTGAIGDSEMNKIISYRRLYEPTLSDFIVSDVREGEVVIDGGANVGYFTLLLAKQVGPSGKVVSIEAAPGNIARLQANCRANQPDGVVDIVEGAIAAEPGRAAFYVHPDNDMWCRLSPPDEDDLDSVLMGNEWNRVEVRADTLASLAWPYGDEVSFIKLDIEGAESLVASSIPGAFKNPKLRVALEVKAPHIRETLEPFRRDGFHIYAVNNDYAWMFANFQRGITETTYDEVCATEHMADVLLARTPLDLSRQEYKYVRREPTNIWYRTEFSVLRHLRRIAWAIKAAFDRRTAQRNRM